MRVVRIYHAGRDPGHRARERALHAAGAEVVLVVPREWPGPGDERVLSAEPFEVVEVDVRRAGDVNRHHAATDDLAAVIERVRPDVVDVHEEPVSLAARNALRAAGNRPVVLYTAQNIDKRYPPPFAQYERSALDAATALYPCSRQAASVARGKGFAGPIAVLPLGFDASAFHAGRQLPGGEIRLGLVGRMVPEKGVLDAVRVLAAVVADRPARLHLVGDGPELGPACDLAASLGVRDRLDVTPWCDAARLAEIYRSLHVVLVPSTATATWVEQFGRIIVEAQASGAVVAAYASGAIPEVVDGAGLVAPEGDVAALSSAVRAALADPVRFGVLRAAGLTAAARRSWESVARAQLALYEQAVRAHAVASIPRPRRPGRAQARAEFGPPAATAAGERPFAVPFLRNPSPLSTALGRLLDVTTPGS